MYFLFQCRRPVFTLEMRLNMLPGGEKNTYRKMIKWEKEYFFNASKSKYGKSPVGSHAVSQGGCFEEGGPRPQKEGVWRRRQGGG